MASALSKGLGYVPTQEPPSTDQITQDFEKICKWNKNHIFLLKEPKRDPHPFRTTSSWQPPKGNQILEKYLTQTILTSDSQVHSAHTNLATEELKALKSLKHNPHIIINVSRSWVLFRRDGMFDNVGFRKWPRKAEIFSVGPFIPLTIDLIP